jgi:beta-glucanase (GH16 family)
MQTIKWSGYEWITQERWGQVHEDKWIQWYDPSAVQIDSTGCLHLYTHKNPKEFSEINRVSPIGIGLVSSTTQFGYGRFEITAKLPSGPWLWPAFWMWSWKSWPPEIDVFEGYSGEKNNYFNPKWNWTLKRLLRPWSIETNLHWMKEETHTSAGYGRGRLGYFKNPTKRFISYRLDWFPDRVEWWWDHKLVQKVDDPIVMQTLKGHKMNVILNNAVMWGIDLDNPTNSDFSIKSFKWTPLLLI